MMCAPLLVVARGIFPKSSIVLPKISDGTQTNLVHAVAAQYLNDSDAPGQPFV
ncbi:hypothetical protein [Candidatus Nitronereus thalassa]|uniref:Uncharacterized protein n=1 Tax=Candidatus Nitronereus thalassa TaxID=3020898 RepID=A0ABU3K7V4_9BACT|nr:hypothetical protein [Candidatus Nitronereus thalassa]MDT7042481.1 hypothetical protein [Candidatus Nitronereus thalassa]